MKTQNALRKVWLGSAVIAGGMALGIANIAVGASEAVDQALAVPDVAPPNRTVAYVLTNRYEAIYQSMDKDGKELKTECPDGIVNTGIREQMAAMFPEPTKQPAGQKYKLVDGHLAHEAEIWWPNTTPDKFPMREAGGKIAFGINLDGKVKDSDFTSPDGKVTGIDNQFYRAVGCIPGYREGSSQRLFYDEYIELRNFNRMIIELTDVDSLQNDDDVTVTTYRGTGSLVKDAKGEFQADTTQRADVKWGQDFIQSSKAKIVNGVLITTKANDWYVAHEMHFNTATEWLRDAHFELNLNGPKMDGLVGGYTDVETAYRSMNRRFNSHIISYGLHSSTAVYKVLRRLADAYPDPVTGENTAISTAWKVIGVRTILVHPEKVADAGRGTKQVAEISGQEKNQKR